MNKRAVLFVTDLIIALSVFVMILGILYVYYYNFSDDYSNKKQDYLRESSMNILLNNLAVGKNSCNLVLNERIVKKIAFCIDLHKTFNKSDLNLIESNYTIYCPNESNKNCININPYIDPLQIPNVEYISEDVNMWVSSGDVSYESYFDCLEGKNCNLSKLVRVYVWNE